MPLITTTTLDHVGEKMVRHRPNIVVSTPYGENDWVGREITLGGVRLRGTLPTLRCAVPTLAHGDLARSTAAVRTLLDDTRVEIPDFGAMPCLGFYAEVLVGGTIHLGDEAHLHQAIEDRRIRLRATMCRQELTAHERRGNSTRGRGAPTRTASVMPLEDALEAALK